MFSKRASDSPPHVQQLFCPLPCGDLSSGTVKAVEGQQRRVDRRYQNSQEEMLNSRDIKCPSKVLQNLHLRQSEMRNSRLFPVPKALRLTVSLLCPLAATWTRTRVKVYRSPLIASMLTFNPQKAARRYRPRGLIFVRSSIDLGCDRRRHRGNGPTRTSTNRTTQNMQRQEETEEEEERKMVSALQVYH